MGISYGFSELNTTVYDGMICDEMGLVGLDQIHDIA